MPFAFSGQARISALLAACVVACVGDDPVVVPTTVSPEDAGVERAPAPDAGPDAGPDAFVGLPDAVFLAQKELYSYRVPLGVTAVIVDAYGAQGGDANRALGGRGGRVLSMLAVTPGQTLVVLVGGRGADGSRPGNADILSATGGYNGGGAGGSAPPGDSIAECRESGCVGGGGGGASDVRSGVGLLDRILVAGGGGGASPYAGGEGGKGGHGGGTTAGDGTSSLAATLYGRGGGPTAAGRAGGDAEANPDGGGVGEPGAIGTGGAGGAVAFYRNGEGGGGGGGWFGGGGGASTAARLPTGGYFSGGGGGGGGSSFAGPGTAETTHQQGVRAGDGLVRICIPGNRACEVMAP